MNKEIQALSSLYKQFVARNTNDRDALLNLIAYLQWKGYNFYIDLHTLEEEFNRKQSGIYHRMIKMGLEKNTGIRNKQYHSAMLVTSIETEAICDMLIIVANMCAPRDSYFELQGQKYILFMPEESDKLPILFTDFPKFMRKK